MHALRIVDELKKRRALGVVPQKQASKRPLDASSFVDLRKKRHASSAIWVLSVFFSATFFFSNLK